MVSDNWSDSPWQRGAYSYWTVGQYIGNGSLSFAGACRAHAPKDIEFTLKALPLLPGYEGVPEPYNGAQTGNCHFAGEHTAYDNQVRAGRCLRRALDLLPRLTRTKGYMNGAVESGNRVASEILGAL